MRESERDGEEKERNRMQSISERLEHSRERWRRNGEELNVINFRAIGALRRELEKKWRAIKCNQFESEGEEKRNERERGEPER